MKHVLLAVIFLCLSSGSMACLQEPVSIACAPCTIEEALDQLDAKVSCSFTYNPRQFNLKEEISLTVSKLPLQEVLEAILDDNLKYKSRGRHLIIESMQPPLDSEPEKQEYIIEGIVKNGKTGEVISQATIYTVGSKYAALSDDNGYYRLKLNTEESQLGISYSKQSYFDTILIVRPADSRVKQDVALAPRQAAPDRIPMRSLRDQYPSDEVDMLPMVRILVPDEQRKIAVNLDFIEDIPFQFSVIPSIGTNKLTSGHSENSLSINLFAGYNAGLKGIEVGSFVNILRQDAKGLQAGGIGNIVGGKVRGIQAAGIFNNVRGSIKGLQAAGVYNLVLDTVQGVQAAGVFNVLDGDIKGAQLAGVFNSASKDMEGLQAAGLFNHTAGEVRWAQIAGFLNNANTVSGGLQLAGFMNRTGDLNGAQIAGAMNIAKDVKGFQTAGALNVAKDVSGQLSGFLNVAKTVSGVQIGVINISDSAKASIGFLSISKKGYKHLDVYADEVHYANLAFRTGTKTFHNIFSLGYGSYYGINLLSYGYGIGTTIPTKKERYEWNIQGHARQVFHLDNPTHPLNLDVSLDVTLHIDFGPVGLLVGPSLHMLIRNGQLQNTDPENGQTLAIQNSFPPIFDEHRGGVSQNLWPGFRVGLRI